jgi:mannose-6-phosphate isomerase-like protein (cupin superfamily)
MDNPKYGRQYVDDPIKTNLPLQKYWGSIQTIFQNSSLVLKMISMNKNTQSSLEYHVSKDEYYYLIKGKLKIGMRIGRAQNISKILNEGELFYIPRGLMHMRIALEDCTILEWSNVDNDEDSNIVEDGATYKHMEQI